VNKTILLKSLYLHLYNELRSAGIEEPRLEARILLAYAAGITQTRIFAYPEDKIDTKIILRLEKMIARRKTGEPIAYIVSTREFWSLNFQVSRDTLIPRPDSETIIEAVLGTIPDKTIPLTILDLGTGSGCLLLALLSELPNAIGKGIDIDRSAHMIAKRNSVNLGLNKRAGFQQGNWMDEVKESFDIIISNPPYISDADMKNLDDSILFFEPHLALSGGPDGLEAYRVIGHQCISHLNPGGLLAVEIGMGQGHDIKVIFVENGLKIKSVHHDIRNIERCILATVKNS
jgi:release factor glutamine methyltransferase